jgi:hypothetical protein
MMKIPYVAMGFIAWACVIGLAVASWTPGQEMVRTGFDPQLEHTTAYQWPGLLFSPPIPKYLRG